MRSAGVLGLAALVLAGCGARHGTAPATPAGPATIGDAATRTIAAGTARFTLEVRGSIGGADIGADERGTVAFTRSRAHIYKLLPSGQVPQELIIDGPLEYTNGDVQAAINDPSVKPWTKLDTRRLTAKQRLSSGEELAHVRTPAYLLEGVARATRIGSAGATTHFRGTVELALLAARLPASLQASILLAVHNDYAGRSFPADFWVDSHDHVRRVRVSYGIKGGGRIVLDATYYDFGAPVRIDLPPASATQDITP